VVVVIIKKNFRKRSLRVSNVEALLPLVHWQASYAAKMGRNKINGKFGSEKNIKANKAVAAKANPRAYAAQDEGRAKERENIDEDSSEKFLAEKCHLQLQEYEDEMKAFKDISRDLNECPLYAHKDTLHCAQRMCIPCLYKLSPNGQFGKIKCAPNQRPESCPRSSKPAGAGAGAGATYAGLYNANMQHSMLTVGDGDLSFSLSVARGVAAARDASLSLSGTECTRGGAGAGAGAGVSAGRSSAGFHLTATTHESLQSLLATYADAADNIAALVSLGVTVLHDVDATQLAASPVGNKTFDVIVWNFPCIGVPPMIRLVQGDAVAASASASAGAEVGTVVVETGKDGQVTELEENTILLNKFFANAPLYLTQRRDGGSTGGTGGEVHVTHKTIEPFNWWDIPAINSNSKSGLKLAGSVVFDRCLYPGYVNRKVLHRKSFPSHDAHTYIFKLSADAPLCALEDQVSPLVQGSAVMQELARAASAASVSASTSAGRGGGHVQKRPRVSGLQQQQHPRSKKLRAH